MKRLLISAVLAFCALPAFSSVSDTWSDPYTGISWAYLGNNYYTNAYSGCSLRNGRLPSFEEGRQALNDGIADRGRNFLWVEGDFNLLQTGLASFWTSNPAQPGQAYTIQVDGTPRILSTQGMTHLVCVVSGYVPPPLPPQPPYPPPQPADFCRDLSPAGEYACRNRTGCDWSYFSNACFVKSGMQCAYYTPHREYACRGAGYPCDWSYTNNTCYSKVPGG